MWIVPLRDKSAYTVVSSIKTIFMMNGSSFILRTDNDKEFCNINMYEMLHQFEVRHVRVSARCPWIQGQVERPNQPIKWKMGSMLMSLNIPGRWTAVREEATLCI
ncbi:hypothetical protein NGRA_3126 [Nosema granulosis]|uniref:Integrase catalytic domain-containing protein n=1 Tax=Nosema granulosis TaxID=83296 RepID=A0A9P6GVW1_9MICR|nr:hypothetical protein NGRA_3126 [Nosema granulosis]